MNAKGRPAEELKEQAERTREAVGETVQKLSDKLDVQARANEGMAKAQQVKDAAMHTLDEAERRIDDLPEAVREPAHRTVSVVGRRPGMVLLGVAGLILLLRLVLRRSHN
jgi:hypothetical protein